MLCANHTSAWDPILLVLAMPQDFNVRIMAKKQLFSIPVVRVVPAEHRRVPRGSGQQRTSTR